MTRSLRKRLETLEGRQAVQSEPCLLIRTVYGVEPQRLGPVGDRLPEVVRMPGESREAFFERTASLIRGEGPVVVYALDPAN